MTRNKNDSVYTLVCEYFENITIDIDRKSKKRIVKVWNIPSSKHVIKFNFYEIIINLGNKKVVLLGHIEGIPYKREYIYKDLNHLEFLINISYIQNCFYSHIDKETSLIFKEKNENEKQIKKRHIKTH